MTKAKKIKYILILIAISILGVVALVAPEYAENVARAFMLIIAGV